MSDVARHPEVGVLVDSSRDQARHGLALAEDVRERGTEGRGSLDGREGELANIVRLVESKDSLDLVEVHVFLHAEHVGVQVLDVLNVAENECLFRVKSKCNDVLDVVEAHANGAFGTIKVELRTVDKLLVICNLDDQRHVEGVLQVLGEDEGDAVTEMEGLSTRAAASVEVKRLSLLVSVEDLSKISLAEENATSNESMDGHQRQFVNSLLQFFRKREASVFVNKLLVVDSLLGSGLDLEGSDNVLSGSVFFGDVDHGL